MKQIIRLTESDLHHMVRSVINEVLDGMDDTEKAYWLMRQRQERPNTKSRTKTDYPSEFANKFNKEVYGNNDGTYSGSYEGTYYNGNRVGKYKGYAGVDPSNGNFSAQQYTDDNLWGAGLGDKYYKSNNFVKNANFRYIQKPEDTKNYMNNTKDGTFYDGPEYGHMMHPSAVNASPEVRKMVNKGLDRYNNLAARYDIQRRAYPSKQ